MVIREHMGRLGEADASPGYSHLDGRKSDRSSPSSEWTRYNPPTVNPPPDAITFTRADVDRDIPDTLARYTALPQDVPRYTLEETLAVAVSRSREYLTAKEELLLAALRLLNQRHLFGPRFFDEISASIDADAEDGDYETALNLVNEFSVSQRLLTGGTLAARALVSATEDLRSRVSDSDGQTASLIFSADIPLMRGAGMVAQESLISAEREMVYATRSFERFRREFLFDIASDYFDLIQSAARIANAERVLDSRRKLLRETELRVRIGDRAGYEISEAQQRVLSSESSLANQRESYILQLERFRIRLGLPPEQPFLIDNESALNLPVPMLDMTESVRRALTFRLDLQNDRDEVDDARRGLENSRNALLPELNLAASMSIITDPDRDWGGLRFDADETDAEGSVTFGLPLDRESERIAVRESMIGLERAIRSLRQREDQIALEVRSAIRNIELAVFNLQLQNRNIESIERRIEGLELRREEVSTRTIIDAQDELAAALNDRDDALRNLRVAILRYLLDTGQFRVSPAGGLALPQGLELLTEQEMQEMYGIRSPELQGGDELLGTEEILPTEPEKSENNAMDDEPTPSDTENEE